MGWPSLGREGVRFVNLALTRQEIADVTGVGMEQVKAPVRAFAGLASGPTADVRVDLVMEDVARLVAFDDASTCEIDFQNEYLVARVDGRVVTVVPDLITAMHLETGEPITAEALRYGQRVCVFAIATPDIMRTPEALDVFGPAAFGLTETFVPVETLADTVGATT